MKTRVSPRRTALTMISAASLTFVTRKKLGNLHYLLMQYKHEHYYKWIAILKNKTLT